MLSLFLSSRQKYVRAMMKAIKLACTDAFEHVHDLGSRADGLRAIRRFEKVNQVAFDPHNSTHLMKISGCARYESLFRKLAANKGPEKSDD